MGFLGQQLAKRVSESSKTSSPPPSSSEQRDEIDEGDEIRSTFGLDVELAGAQWLDGSGMTCRQGGCDRQRGGDRGRALRRIGSSAIFRGRGRIAWKMTARRWATFYSSNEEMMAVGDRVGGGKVLEILRENRGGDGRFAKMGGIHADV